MNNYYSKSWLVLCLYITAAVFFVSTAYAEKQSGTMAREHSPAVGATQSSKMMSGGMMDQEHMRDMSQLMLQTRDMISDMSLLMTRDRIRDPDHMNNLAELTAQLSNNFQEMSQHLKQGSLTPQELTKMQDRIKDATKKMDQLHKDVAE
jgi:phage tail tape-measure protein